MCMQNPPPPPTATPTHTHTLVDRDVNCRLSEHCNSHPSWSDPQISSSRGTPRSSIAPNYWGMKAESTAAVLIQSNCLGGNQPLFMSALSWALQVGLQKEPLKLSFSEREHKWPEILAQKDLCNFVERHSSFSCNAFTEIKRASLSWECNQASASHGKGKAYRFNLFAIYCVHACARVCVCSLCRSFCFLQAHLYYHYTSQHSTSERLCQNVCLLLCHIS